MPRYQPGCGLRPYDPAAQVRPQRRLELKLADKPRSLFMLGQHLGLFPRGRDREGVRAGDVQLSDMELAQRILGILARTGKGGAEEGGGEAGSWSISRSAPMSMPII